MNSLRFGPSICVALSLLCAGSVSRADADGVPEAQKAVSGRILQQSATAGNNGEFQICTRIFNKELEDIYMTRGFRYQIRRHFTDEGGRPDFPKRSLIPSPPPPPPPPDSTFAYFVLEAGSRLEVCSIYKFSDFSSDIIHVQSTFNSWLSRESELPREIQRNIGELNIVGRPLFTDEILYSNFCVIDRMAKTVRCQ